MYNGGHCIRHTLLQQNDSVRVNSSINKCKNKNALKWVLRSNLSWGLSRSIGNFISSPWFARDFSRPVPRLIALLFSHPLARQSLEGLSYLMLHSYHFWALLDLVSVRYNPFHMPAISVLRLFPLKVASLMAMYLGEL